MKTGKIIYILTTLFPLLVKAQFAPPAGQNGTTAIFKDSSIIKAWATRCTVVRGWQDINDTSLGKVSYGTDTAALGEADNNVVSLGDSGYAIVSFDEPVVNGEGYDFAVFENAFNDEFLELAFVEVSSDSIHWARFPAVSLTDTTEQVGTFGTLEAEKIHNLAGKYRVLYGTPFDLSELTDTEFVDVNNIKYIRITDVIGSVKTSKYSTDSQGNKINDPYPTAFNTGGFDLDAVAILKHTVNNNSVFYSEVKIFPNPANKFFTVISEQTHHYSLINTTGEIVLQGKLSGKTTLINTSDLPQGVYFLKITGQKVKKIIVLH